MLRNRTLRRGVAVTLLIVGALLMWLAPEVAPGVVVLVLGVVIEFVGIALEHRDAQR